MNRLALLASGLALAALFSTPCFADAASGPVTCTDGSTSAHGGKGACSHHGGIKKDGAAPAAAAAAPAAAAPAAAPAAPAAAAPAAKPAATMAAAKPAKSAAMTSSPEGATAKCKDGSFSKSKHHSGTCSRHGGVDSWLDGSAAK